MTKDDIIRMAEEARLVIDGNNSGQDDLLYFAALVRADEREACAAMFDDRNVWDEEVGERIRARRTHD